MKKPMGIYGGLLLALTLAIFSGARAWALEIEMGDDSRKSHWSGWDSVEGTTLQFRLKCNHSQDKNGKVLWNCQFKNVGHKKVNFFGRLCDIANADDGCESPWINRQLDPGQIGQLAYMFPLNATCEITAKDVWVGVSDYE